MHDATNNCNATTATQWLLRHQSTVLGIGPFHTAVRVHMKLLYVVDASVATTTSLWRNIHAVQRHKVRDLGVHTLPR